MTLSAAALQSVQAQESGEVKLFIFEISHVSLSTPLRFVFNDEDVTHDGETYTAINVDAPKLPRDEADRLPVVRFAVDNVSQWLTPSMRAMDRRDGPPSMTVKIILASSPNTVEYGPLPFSIEKSDFDAGRYIFHAQYQSGKNQRWPGVQMRPDNCAGVFDL